MKEMKSVSTPLAKFEKVGDSLRRSVPESRFDPLLPSDLNKSPDLIQSFLVSLALIRTYDDDEIACLNRSRLADLVPQLEVLFLNSRIIQRGLDYLIPAYSRTLFEFNPPSSDDTIDLLQVAEHLRMPEECHRDEVFAEFVASIANQDRQISLRSVYLNISLRDLPSRQVGLLEAIQKLRRVCMEKGIEVTYEDLEVGFLGEVRPSEEFGRRQRAVRRPEAIDE